MTDYEDEDEVEIKTETEVSDFAKGAWCSNYYAIKRPPVLHNNIKSSTQGVWSKIRCATSSSIMKVARILSLVHL